MITIRNNTSYPIDGIIGYILDRYFPSCSGTLVVCHNETALRHYSTLDVELEALLYRDEIAENHYIMILRKGTGLHDRIVCHELAHLMQLIKGDLSFNLQSKTFIWKGEQYDASIKYEDRPWEREAFSMEVKLLKEYRSSKKERHESKLNRD